MKKINTLKQLRAEKELLRQRGSELEKIIRCDWIELKRSVHPFNLFSMKSEDKEMKKRKSIIGVVIGALTETLLDKAWKKIQDGFKN